MPPSQDFRHLAWPQEIAHKEDIATPLMEIGLCLLVAARCHLEPLASGRDEKQRLGKHRIAFMKYAVLLHHATNHSCVKVKDG